MIRKYKSNKTGAVVTACLYTGTPSTRGECWNLGEGNVINGTSKESLISYRQNEKSKPAPIPTGHYLIKFESGLLDLQKAKAFEDEYKRIK